VKVEQKQVHSLVSNLSICFSFHILFNINSLSFLFVPIGVRGNKSLLDSRSDPQDVLPTLHDAVVPKEDQGAPPHSRASSQPHVHPHSYNCDGPTHSAEPSQEIDHTPLVNFDRGERMVCYCTLKYHEHYFSIKLYF
jgi:hypothetical protein